jgi:hypothetical protein
MEEGMQPSAPEARPQEKAPSSGPRRLDLVERLRYR